MRRTATVKALDYSTISCMSLESLQELQLIFPNLISKFKQGITHSYKDQDMEYKKRLVRNVPYFSKLNENIILEIVCLMKQEKFDKDSKIIKRGDNVKNLYFLNEGILEVQVPFLNNDLHFDFLNPGSNFCVFSCFNSHSQSIMNFTAYTSCIISYIEVEDLT